MNMKMKISKQIENIVINVTPARSKIGDIVAFVELQFLDEQNNLFIIGRGYTICVKAFKNLPTFTVNAPAFKSGFNYKTSFIIEDKSLWMNLTKAILEEFSNQTGGVKPEDYITGDLNPNDIPL